MQISSMSVLLYSNCNWIKLSWADEGSGEIRLTSGGAEHERRKTFALSTDAESAECDWFLFTMHQYPLMSIKKRSFTSMIHPHTLHELFQFTLKYIIELTFQKKKAIKLNKKIALQPNEKNIAGDIKRSSRIFSSFGDVETFYFFKIGIVYKSQRSFKGFLRDFILLFFLVCCEECGPKQATFNGCGMPINCLEWPDIHRGKTSSPPTPIEWNDFVQLNLQFLYFKWTFFLLHSSWVVKSVFSSFSRFWKLHKSQSDWNTRHFDKSLRSHVKNADTNI